MSAKETHEEDQRSYRRHFNQWRYPVGLNCHLCISEIIDRFTQVEKEKGLRSRYRKTSLSKTQDSSVKERETKKKTLEQ